jgi:hypothetical protein
MRKLPEYFAIKRKKKDPRWKTYIKWLNTTYSVGLDGTSDGYPYYGFGGSIDSNNMYEASPSHFPNTPTVITLDEFFECFFGSNTSQDANSTFPAKWCIKDGLSDSVTEFFNENGTSQYSGDTDGLLHYPAYHGKCLHNNILAGYTEISLAEFREHVLNNNQKTNNTMAKTYQVKKAELERIHEVACSTWKSKIAELTLRNPFGDGIELTQTEVDNMFAAATESQRPVLVAVFGEPNKAIDLSSNQVAGLELFKRDGTTMSTLIAVRLSGEMKNKAFYLNSDFTWEIKTDASGEACLVPTRK